MQQGLPEIHGAHALVVGSEDARRVLREVAKPKVDVLVLGTSRPGRVYARVDVFARVTGEAAKRWLASVCAVDAEVQRWVP